MRHRLANSASKLGSGFRLRDEILGGFPIFRKVQIATHFPTRIKRNLSIPRIDSRLCLLAVPLSSAFRKTS